MAKEKDKSSDKDTPGSKQPELEKVANEAAEKIKVKREKKLQPSEETIAEIAQKKSEEEDDSDKEPTAADNDSSKETVAQFSTDLSKDPVKEDEGGEQPEEGEELKPKIESEEVAFPEIPKELKVNDILKKPKDKKKYKVVVISALIGITLGAAILYVLRTLGII